MERREEEDKPLVRRWRRRYWWREEERRGAAGQLGRRQGTAAWKHARTGRALGRGR